MIFEENRFENILASLRVRKGWTQEDAVAHIKDIGKGISRHTYIDLEKGNLPPSEKHLKLIAAGFKLNQADTDVLYHAAHHGSPRIHNLPFRRNPLFTGREDQLKQLAQLLKENYSVALSGLAGIGKTQLALEYAHKCYVEKVYSGVFWVNAADEESLQISYAKLAEKLDLPERDEQELAKIVEAVKQWLDDHTDWLLIMDNADNLQLARSFFPEAHQSKEHQGRILLTTRSLIVGDVPGDIIEVGKMQPAEGLFFLLRRALRRTHKLRDEAALDSFAADIREAAAQVVELLGGNPLALDQAGAYIEDDPLVSFTDYINLYDEKRRDLLSERGSLDEEHEGKDSYHPETVDMTFRLCFEMAHKRHPLATDILRFCAFLHPDAIPNELFLHDDTFRLDRTALRKGIIALLRYSLIRPNAQEKTYSVHRLVQAVLVDDISPDDQKQWRERVVRALNAAFPMIEFKHWRQCERLLSHALLCATWPENELTPTIEVARLFHQAGSCLEERLGYSESEIHNEDHIWKSKHRKLPWWDTAYQFLEPDNLRRLNDLKALDFMQGNDRQAESLLVRALSIREKHLGIEHPDTAKSLHRLAVLYHRQRKYEQAELLYRRAISILEKHLGAENPDILPYLAGLESLLEAQGQHEQADALHLRCLMIHFGLKSPRQIRFEAVTGEVHDERMRRFILYLGERSK